MHQRTFYGSCPYGGELVVQIVVLWGDYKCGGMMLVRGTVDYYANLILMRTFVIWYRITKCPLVFGVPIDGGRG